MTGTHNAELRDMMAAQKEGCALPCALMLFAGITLMRFGWDTMLPMLDIPESFRTLAITLSGALIVLHAGTRGIIRILTYSDWHPQFETQES